MNRYETALSSSKVLRPVKTPGKSYRGTLERLLRGDLNFHEENGNYATHNLHAFAAKFPPQIPRTFITNLTSEGEVILDPMVGSGTTIIEALLLNRKAIGLDLDPLSIRINRAKLICLGHIDISPSVDRVITKAEELLEQAAKLEAERKHRFDSASLEFINYWFLPRTQQELLSLILAIEDEPDSDVRQVLELIFSSTIVTKSGGVSMARDLAHSRPHMDLTKIPKNAVEEFRKRARRFVKELSQFPKIFGDARVENGDARHMEIPSNSVDLVVTSPPYANAIDYMRAHKFSLVWFREPISQLSDLRAKYIGSERIGKLSKRVLPPKTLEIIHNVTEKDAKKAKILHKYYSDMEETLEETYRVLKPGRVAIIVIGSSTMRGLDVKTHECLAEIANFVGFEVVGLSKRQLDRNRRMMPARFKGNGDSQIENRIHEEYVLGLIIPESLNHAK
ncbi:hypothetical protein GX441_04895 [bacterium]|nr:hypothetical protein [bacterium]